LTISGYKVIYNIVPVLNPAERVAWLVAGYEENHVPSHWLIGSKFMQKHQDLLCILVTTLIV
jgi:hypothetical protein